MAKIIILRWLRSAGSHLSARIAGSVWLASLASAAPAHAQKRAVLSVLFVLSVVFVLYVLYVLSVVSGSPCGSLAGFVPGKARTTGGSLPPALGVGGRLMSGQISSGRR